MLFRSALAWAIEAINLVPEGASYLHMFDAWEMKSISVEEAREATGLLIVLIWMCAVMLLQPRAGEKA